jgi:hypothetical protein
MSVLAEKLYTVSEHGGVERVQRLSLLRPTPNNPWDTGQTKDNTQSRHHIYTTDYYYSTAASVHPQQHYSTTYKYEATNPRGRD